MLVFFQEFKFGNKSIATGNIKLRWLTYMNAWTDFILKDWSIDS